MKKILICVMLVAEFGCSWETARYVKAPAHVVDFATHDCVSTVTGLSENDYRNAMTTVGVPGTVSYPISGAIKYYNTKKGRCENDVIAEEEVEN